MDGPDPCLPGTDAPIRKMDGPSCPAHSLHSLGGQEHLGGAGGVGKREVPRHCYDEKETVEAEIPQAWLAGISFSLKHAPARCCGPLPFEVSTPS